MIAVILAGGTGTRLWPYSRVMTPKQFLNLGSTHESLFQETCRRIESVVSAENIFVEGVINADIETETLHLKATGIVDGDVFYRNIIKKKLS